MSRGLRIAPTGGRDIVGAYNWYEEQQPGLGEQFRAGGICASAFDGSSMNGDEWWDAMQPWGLRVAYVVELNGACL